jgi:hypothetical protein
MQEWRPEGVRAKMGRWIRILRIRSGLPEIESVRGEDRTIHDLRPDRALANRYAST